VGCPQKQSGSSIVIATEDEICSANKGCGGLVVGTGEVVSIAAEGGLGTGRGWECSDIVGPEEVEGSSAMESGSGKGDVGLYGMVSLIRGV
jgi:hypothetical protein